jgi:uncharacterized protein (TIGR02452 family)
MQFPESHFTVSCRRRSGETHVPEFCISKNPGGGFINGAEAQEESLARTSDFTTVCFRVGNITKPTVRMESCFYTDMMIYSPKVPVFRKDKGELLDQPVLCNFITFSRSERRRCKTSGTGKSG